jgi:hypothetical protein
VAKVDFHEVLHMERVWDVPIHKDLCSFLSVSHVSAAFEENIPIEDIDDEEEHASIHATLSSEDGHLIVRAHGWCGECKDGFRVRMAFLGTEQTSRRWVAGYQGLVTSKVGCDIQGSSLPITLSLVETVSKKYHVEFVLPTAPEFLSFLKPLGHALRITHTDVPRLNATVRMETERVCEWVAPVYMYLMNCNTPGCNDPPPVLKCIGMEYLLVDVEFTSSLDYTLHVEVDQRTMDKHILPHATRFRILLAKKGDRWKEEDNMWLDPQPLPSPYARVLIVIVFT